MKTRAALSVFAAKIRQERAMFTHMHRRSLVGRHFPIYNSSSRYFIWGRLGRAGRCNQSCKADHNPDIFERFRQREIPKWWCFYPRGTNRKATQLSFFMLFQAMTRLSWKMDGSRSNSRWIRFMSLLRSKSNIGRLEFNISLLIRCCSCYWPPSVKSQWKNDCVSQSGEAEVLGVATKALNVCFVISIAFYYSSSRE